MATRDVLEVKNGDRMTVLGMSTFAFTVCFAVWTIFSIIGIQIKKDLGLNDTQFGLLVGTPILTGSLIRLSSASGPISTAAASSIVGVMLCRGDGDAGC